MDFAWRYLQQSHLDYLSNYSPLPFIRKHYFVTNIKLLLPIINNNLQSIESSHLIIWCKCVNYNAQWNRRHKLFPSTARVKFNNLIVALVSIPLGCSISCCRTLFNTHTGVVGKYSRVQFNIKLTTTNY